MSMRAVVLDGFGDVDVLQVGSVDKPQPASGQVLIQVAATSINRPDLVQREGNYPPPQGDSEILGLEVAGKIAELGPDVSGWQVGDKVMSLVGGGGYAEYAVAYASHLIPIPDSMSYEEAACVCESYITAFSNVFMLGELQDGQRAIFHGGGGGVNTAALQLSQALTPNTDIIVTAAPEKMDRVKELGANLVINYKENPDFSPIIKEYTSKQGVNMILDHVGTKYLEPNIKSLGYEGRLVVIGVISGIKAELNLALMMVKRQRIIGSVLRSRPVDNKAEIVSEFRRRAMPRFADRSVVPIIEKVFALDDIKQAHGMMEKDQHFGKIVLKIADL